MRITVRGWGRDLGETTIMSGGLTGAESPGGKYSRNKLYKAVEYADNPRLTKVRISTSAEVRLGGTYLLHVELSRKEIAQLSYTALPDVPQGNEAYARKGNGRP
jgi:hypothetical protein